MRVRRDVASELDPEASGAGDFGVLEFTGCEVLGSGIGKDSGPDRARGRPRSVATGPGKERGVGLKTARGTAPQTASEKAPGT